jgi:hypothetical protein
LERSTRLEAVAANGAHHISGIARTPAQGALPLRVTLAAGRLSAKVNRVKQEEK